MTTFEKKNFKFQQKYQRVRVIWKQFKEYWEILTLI